MEKLLAAGFAQYEIPAFAQSGRRSRHNLNYWRYGDYLAIGAGAHGKITLDENNSVQRFAKHRHTKQYLRALESGDSLAQQFEVGAAECVFEFFMNQLRLKQGVYFEDFTTPIFHERL